VEAKPDCRVEDEDEREFVRRSVRKLPRSLRVPLLLKWWRDWSYARIAARLKLTEGAVAMRIHRAYARLKEILRPPDRE
jgi:DNA-directed RNA polymerase specialized sigma24 family protein